MVRALCTVDGLVGVMKRSGESTRFVTLMELTGVTERLQQMHQFTVFLPSDDALQVISSHYVPPYSGAPTHTHN